MNRLPEEIPQATFHKQVLTTSGATKWVTLTTDQLFKDKTVIV
ncbi:uncharacterized protein METZ01_LOCUS490008, partial [marine metagenome]